jgi:hypothetical protein
MQQSFGLIMTRQKLWILSAIANANLVFQAIHYQATYQMKKYSNWNDSEIVETGLNKPI